MTQHRIGIDLGGTKIEIAALAPDGTETLRHRIATPPGYDATLDGIAALVREAEAELGVTATVGIGIPGVISPATGLVKNANSIALNGHAFDHDISAPLGREVRVENDANCFALSEATDGAGAGHRRGVRRHPGHRLRRRHRRARQGASRAAPVAGEWGHNPLPWPRLDEVPGPPCWCGQWGCLETWVAGPSLARDCDGAGRARRLRHSRPRRRRRSACAGGAGPACRPVGARAGAGGQPARPRRDRAGRRAVEHGASLSRAAAAAAPLRVQRLVHTPILRNKHGDSSGVRGAAWLWPAAS